MLNLGAGEICMLLLVALMVFGPERLPELFKTVGRALREFQRASAEVRQTMHESLADVDTATLPRVPSLKEMVSRIGESPTRAEFAAPAVEYPVAPFPTSEPIPAPPVVALQEPPVPAVEPDAGQDRGMPPVEEPQASQEKPS
jgi:sec-independent protein translocase protein TatA